MSIVFVCVSALAVTSEAYYSALSKIGKKALHTISSRSLGRYEHMFMWLCAISVETQRNYFWIYSPGCEGFVFDVFMAIY